MNVQQFVSKWKEIELSEIAVDSISDYQMADLNRLKEWLYRKRTEARLARERSERRQEREAQAVRRKAEHPVLFEF